MSFREIEVWYTCGGTCLAYVWELQVWYTCRGFRFGTSVGDASLVYVWGMQVSHTSGGAGLVYV